MRPMKRYLAFVLRGMVRWFPLLLSATMVAFVFFVSSRKELKHSEGMAFLSSPSRGVSREGLSPEEGNASSTHMQSANQPQLLWTVHCFLRPSEPRFTLKHEMGLKSILKKVKPDILYVHYAKPEQLKNLEWQEIVEMHYNVEALLLPNRKGSVDMRERMEITRTFGGGMVIDMAAVVQQELAASDAHDWCKMDKQQAIVFLFAHCAYYSNVSLLDRCLNNEPACSEFVQSMSSQDVSSNSLMLQWGSQADAMFEFGPHPKVHSSLYNFFSTEDFAQPWYDIARRLYCDGCPALEPPRHPEAVVPNLVHYIWFDTSWEMTFLQMVAISSALHVLQPDHVLVHSNVQPTGPHWTYLVTRHRDRITWHLLPKFLKVWQIELNPSIPHANSDIARLHVLRKYGGIYLDSDLIVLKSHEPFRHYDAVIGPAYPYTADNLQNSHVLFSRDSKFLGVYLQSYKAYDGSFLFNSVILPMRLYRKHPHLIRVEKLINFCPQREAAHMLFSNQLDAVVREQLQRAYSIEFSGVMENQGSKFLVASPEFGFHLLNEDTVFGAILRLAINGSQLTI